MMVEKSRRSCGAKGLKALLIERTSNFRRIHDVVELSRRVKAPSKITEERIEIVGKLREFIKKHPVEKAILFGSFARGEAREDSDIDLILVSKEFEGKSALKRPVPFYIDWHLGYPVDFLCYTPKEFNDLKKQVSIVSQALKEGIEIV